MISALRNMPGPRSRLHSGIHYVRTYVYIQLVDAYKDRETSVYVHYRYRSKWVLDLYNTSKHNKNSLVHFHKVVSNYFNPRRKRVL